MSSSIILAFGTIVVTLLIYEGDYGLYTIALVPATTFLLFQDWGIGTALTKFCASYRGKKEEHRLRSMVVAGMKFEVATALILTAFSLLFSGFIASSVFSKPETAGVMIILNLSIFFNAMLAAANSVFIGFERMGLLSICSICAAIAQSGLTVLLVYFGYGAMGAAVGYTFSSIVVGILAVALLYFAIFRKLSRDETSKFTTYQTLKPMFKYGLPLALSAVLVGVASQFSWFVLSSNVDLSSIGNLRVTQNFMVLLTFVAFPISTSLFPAFSKLDPKNEKPLIASVFAASVKYAVLFLIPATMVMMVLAKPIIGTIYGDKWALAPTFLTLGIINYLFTIFGSLSISSFLSAMEETKLILMSSGNSSVWSDWRYFRWLCG
jgi:O-antigen/teichoic acid export membrane protein